MLLQSPRSLLATTPNIKLTFNITAYLHGLLPRSQSNYGPLFFRWLDISPWYKQTKSASSPACVSTALTFYPTLDSPSLVSSFSSSLFLLRSSRLQTLGFTSQLASFPLVSSSHPIILTIIFLNFFMSEEHQIVCQSIFFVPRYLRVMIIPTYLKTSSMFPKTVVSQFYYL